MFNGSKAAVLWRVHRDKDKDKHGNEDEAQGKASCRRSATNRAAVRIKRTHAIIGAHYGVLSLFLLAAYVTNVRNIDTLFEKEQGYFYLNSVRRRCGLPLSAQRYISLSISCSPCAKIAQQ